MYVAPFPRNHRKLLVMRSLQRRYLRSPSQGSSSAYKHLSFKHFQPLEFLAY